MSKEVSFSSKFSSAISWFNSQKKERQFYLITEMFSEQTKLGEELSEEEGNQLVVVADEIAVALARHDREEVLAELVSLGMDDTAAKIFVEKIQGARKPLYIQLRVIKDLTDDQLKALVEGILVDFYQESTEIEEIAAKTRLPTGAVNATFQVFRDHLLFQYLRGQTSVRKVQEMLIDNGLKAEQAKIVTDLLLKHSAKVGQIFLFRNVQDNYFRLRQLTESLDNAWNAIRELSEMLGKRSKPKSGYIG